MAAPRWPRRSLTACLGHPNNAGARNGTLTISGDAGNPTLVENFNPFQPTTELHGTYLLYEPLEIRSPVDGTFTPFLATGTPSATRPRSGFHPPAGVKWSDGQAFSAADVAFTFTLLKKYPALDTTGVWAQLSRSEHHRHHRDLHLQAAQRAVRRGAGRHPDRARARLVQASATRPSTPTPNRSAPGRSRWPSSRRPSTSWPRTRATGRPTRSRRRRCCSRPPRPTPTAQQLDTSNGRFDWSYSFLPDVKQTFVARNPQYNKYWFPPGGVIGLYLNLTKAPYNNADYRRGHLTGAEPQPDRAEGGQRLPARRQPVRPDPAQPAEVAGPEPAEQGQCQPGPARQRWTRSRRPATPSRATGWCRRPASRPA